MKGPSWSESEEDILRTYYPTEGLVVARRLPGRTHSAIVVRAGLLKLRIAERKPRTARAALPITDVVKAQSKSAHRSAAGLAWDDDEDAILQAFFPSEGIAVIDRLRGRTVEAVRHRIAVLGLRVDTKEIRRAQALTNGQYASLIKPQAAPTQAELLAGLPWLKYPTSPQGCDKIAAMCAREMLNADPESDATGFLRGLGATMQELSKRLRAKVAA